MDLECSEIRSKTRIALPADDSYIFRLGVALYCFASTNGFMTEIICHVASIDRSELLSDKTSGQVLDAFRQTLKQIKKSHQYVAIHETMQDTADLFEHLNTERTDIVHAYPITSKEGEQVLHRRKDKKRKYFVVDCAFLDSFISRLDEVHDGLYVIRKEVKPELGD